MGPCTNLAFWPSGAKAASEPAEATGSPSPSCPARAIESSEAYTPRFGSAGDGPRGSTVGGLPPSPAESVDLPRGRLTGQQPGGPTPGRSPT